MLIQGKPEGVREKFDSPRKHRGRATATEDSDCFTCNELQRKCDRRRPYCAQCLEYGKDCSDYKTALTWNIGVSSRSKLRGLALPITTSEKVSRQSIASGRKKIAISSQLQDQASEDSNFMHASSSQPSYSPAEFGTKQYSFVNMNPHYSALEMPSTSSPSALSNTRCQAASQSKTHISSRIHKRARRHSLKPLLVSSLDHLQEHDVALSANAVGSYHSHSSGISAETSLTATCLAASEQHHRDLSDPLASVTSFNDEPFMGHGPMGWSQGSCFTLSPEQNSSNYLNLQPLPTVPIVIDTADDIRFGQPAFDIYGFSVHNWKDFAQGYLGEQQHHYNRPRRGRY